MLVRLECASMPEVTLHESSKEPYVSGPILFLYNHLDNTLRMEMRLDSAKGHHDVLREKERRDPAPNGALRQLRRFAEFRNALVHWNGETGSEEPVAGPHPAIVDRYEKLVNYVLKPSLALDIEVASANIC